jgi:hypothetical protein
VGEMTQTLYAHMNKQTTQQKEIGLSKGSEELSQKQNTNKMV